MIRKRSLSRKDRTISLTEAVQCFWASKRFSSHVEIGVERRGKLRADVLSLNTKCCLTITEIKSCWQDFRTDSKWTKYLRYCHKMYFAIDNDLFESKGKEIGNKIKSHGCGLIVYDGTSCNIRLRAKERPMNNADVANLLIKMSWRGGRFKE